MNTIAGLRKAEVRALLRARDGDACFLCGKSLDFAAEPLTPEYPTIEHKRASASGGADKFGNLALAHRRCNERKADKPLGSAWRHMRKGPLPNPVKARG